MLPADTATEKYVDNGEQNDSGSLLDFESDRQVNNQALCSRETLNQLCVTLKFINQSFLVVNFQWQGSRHSHHDDLLQDHPELDWPVPLVAAVDAKVWETARECILPAIELPVAFTDK